MSLGTHFGLRHCEDWQCLMASSHSVELVDVKSAEFCGDCARLVRVQTIKQSRRACQLPGTNGNLGQRNSGR
jgi:predicted Zn-dependent protease